MRVRFLSFVVLLGIASLLPLDAAAQSGGKCTLRNNWCSPFIGCIETDDRFFVGFTLGRREGPLFAQTDDGVLCRGTWKRGTFGGRARFACSDGKSGKLTYRHLHKQTGTAVGKGRLKSGEKIEAWAGHKLFEYFVLNDQIQEGILRCGNALLDNFEVTTPG